MVCCLNPYCDGNDNNPVNPDGARRCQYCGKPLIPLLLNRFKVLQVLGQGGFGRTYLAEDQHKLNDNCVIKQLLPQGGSKAVELFKREAEQLKRLGKDNPQIPTLEAYFQENNALFLVQQYIEGKTLAQELARRGKFTEEQVRELLADWLPLLATVHREGVVHRDLKPENLMRRQDTGNVVMIDFGLSKDLRGSVMVMPGTMAGTFGYAPFEQMEGGEAYPSSDLFAVGATCFHLLSGMHPGKLWKDSGYGWVKSWQSHLDQTLSPELVQVIDKCLFKEHTQRYRSAQEVLSALQTLVKVSEPKPRQTQPPLSDPLEPPPIKTQPTRRAFPEPAKPATDEASQTLQADQVLKQQQRERQERLAKQQEQLEKVRQARNYFDRALAKQNSGDKKGAIVDYDKAIQLNPNYSLAYNNRGLAKSALGDKKGAIVDYDKAIQLNPNDAQAYNNRGLAKSALGDKKGAIVDYDKAIQLNPNDALAYNNRGWAKSDLGDNQGAIVDYNKAIQINQNWGDIGLYAAYNNRGLAKYNLGDNQGAIVDYDKAIELNPNYAAAYYKRGLAYQKLRENQRALADFREAARLYQQQGNTTWYQKANDRIRQLRG